MRKNCDAPGQTRKIGRQKLSSLRKNTDFGWRITETDLARFLNNWRRFENSHHSLKSPLRSCVSIHVSANIINANYPHRLIGGSASRSRLHFVIAFGPPHHSRPNGSLSEIRSRPASICWVLFRTCSETSRRDYRRRMMKKATARST
jgi:hypothetical protein